jgi:hypothetical protein
LILLNDFIALTVQFHITSAKEKKTTRCNEFGLILLLSLVRKWIKLGKVTLSHNRVKANSQVRAAYLQEVP